MTEDLKGKRSIRQNAGASTRTFKRQIGCAVEVIEITRTTKSLIKGGTDGRIYSADTDWNYFFLCLTH